MTPIRWFYEQWIRHEDAQRWDLAWWSWRQYWQVRMDRGWTHGNGDAMAGALEGATVEARE